MRDLLRLAAHIAGIALTISLIPLSAVLMLTDHEAWGAACLGAALAAVWLAARLDRRAHEQTRRDPVDQHFADTVQALNTPTMRLPAAAGRIEVICDGQPGCVRRIHGDVQAVDRIARSSGWQLGAVDLCPDCKALPQFRAVADA